MSALAEKLARVAELRSQLDAVRPLPREVEERVLQKFRLWWTYHSNALEGNALTLGETQTFLMEGLTAKGKPLKDHLDIRGHHAAIDYLLEFIRKKETLTEAVIRELHKVILGEDHYVEAENADGQPVRKLIRVGEYKTEPNARRTPTGERKFYASPTEAPARMRDLITAYREDSARGEKHVVEIAARFHHEFTAIHPFDDGNGRMTRLLTNLILMQAGFPPIVIRTQERNAYIFALSKGDQGELEDITVFTADHLIEAMELYLRGARGEEISEPTDVDKEIAILKRELSRSNAEIPKAALDTRRIVEQLALPAWNRIGPKLKSLGDLFWNAGIAVSVSGKSHSGEPYKISTALPGTHLSVTSIQGYTPRDEPYAQVQFQVTLRGYNGSGTHPFDVQAKFSWRFDATKYSLVIEDTKPAVTLESDYGEEIPRDQLNKAMDSFVSYFVDEIRKRADGKPQG